MYSGYVHAPNPRRRQPSSTSSTLLTPSEGSEWMPRASTSTSRSVFSDGEDTNKGDGDERTEVGTVNMDKIRDERPLIDFGDDPSQTRNNVDEGEVGPTPGDKLRMLLRQMEAEVRNTTPAPAPAHAPTPQPRRLSFQDRQPFHAEEEETIDEEEEDEEDFTPAPAPKSHWREGRRIGALPKERSFSPVPSPERRRSPSNHGQEEMEDDSPPTPPLRITNPYLYNNRRVSDERRSVSPRISSRAAVLHASTSRSPPVPPELHRSHLENYLARAPTSPSRKGKERATTPESSPRANITATKTKGKTPRKWSVEIAPDDSVLFAEGIELNGNGNLDIDESVEPPWEEEETEDEGASPELELPALPEIAASYDESSEEEVEPVKRPESRIRSRFSHSLSTSQSRTQPQAQRTPPKSPSSSRSIRQQDLSNSHSQSRSISQDQSTSFTTARTNSLKRSTRPIPPVQPVFPQEIQVGMAFTPPISTPPRANTSIQVPAQTPKPPGAWLSASKPSTKVKFTPSPSPLRHQGDTSIHRIKVHPRRSPNTSKEEEGDISLTQRLISFTKTLTRPTAVLTIPKPSTTLLEAREQLAKAAEASAIAQRRVEVSQRQWLDALSSGGAEAVRQGWTWGKWGWWVSMEILLLWGVFRVTLEYAHVNTSHRPFDTPSYALAIPLPTAISAFVIPSTNRRSANFFDILEGLEIWRVLGAGEDVGRGRIPT